MQAPIAFMLWRTTGAPIVDLFELALASPRFGIDTAPEVDATTDASPDARPEERGLQ